MALAGVSTILSFLGGAAGSGAGGPITNTVSYTTNQLMPVVMPDYSELINSFLLGDIPTTTFRELSLNHGRAFATLDSLFTYTREDGGVAGLDNGLVNRARSPNARSLQANRYMPSIDEVKVLLNRKLISEELAEWIINRQTTYNPALTNAHLEMRYEIPGPSDLVRFAVRDCFTPAVVSQFEYAKETPTEIKPWMDKQGYGQEIGLTLPANATAADDTTLAGQATWFDLYWWSHWDLPSPTQGYEMLHRLYPESDYGPSPYITPTNKFESADLELLLKASDYPNYWRERLIAISYHNLNRSDVLPMYDRGLVTESEVYHALRADGYRDEEAKRLLRLANFRKQQYLGVDIQKKSKEWICKTYGEGYITRDSAEHRLEQLGLTHPGIGGFLDQCDLDNAYKINQQVLGSLKTGYVRGILTESNIRDSMNTFLLSSLAIDRKVNTWTILRNVRYKQLSATKNLSAFEKGLINQNELVARLQNLQYEPVAISTMLGISRYNIAQRDLKRLQAQIAMETKAAKEAQRIRKEVEKEERKKLKEKESNIERYNNKRIRKLIVAMNDKNIIAYWKAKTVFLWEIFYRLYYRDFLIIDARKWVKTFIDGVTEKEMLDAETQAQKVYRSEPNPPLM